MTYVLGRIMEDPCQNRSSCVSTLIGAGGLQDSLSRQISR
ncbi:hypothetical protein RSAG8_07964, partial [Rhizoctonia solani AG-8 WAC10335]